MRRVTLATLLLLLVPLTLTMPLAAQQERAPFLTPLTLDQMRDKQAVVETTEGVFVIDLLPDAAPNHVGLFMREVENGTFDGTSFHGDGCAGHHPGWRSDHEGPHPRG